MNLAFIHIISSATQLTSTIATASTADLQESHLGLSVFISNQEPDHLTELIKSVQDAIKVELSTRKP